MSDIVCAVNPHTDSLSDLTRRMHRFAEETLGAADIALNFSAPPDDVDPPPSCGDCSSALGAWPAFLVLAGLLARRRRR